VSIALGQRIRRAREREGLTQAALGHKVRVAQPTVAVWESGGGLTEANRKNLERVLGPLSVRKGAQGSTVPDAEISSFGVWLRDQRGKASMSVPELAKSSGVSAPAIYNVETGKIQNPQAATRDKLGKALKQSVPQQVVTDTEREQVIAGLGSLTDFDPYGKKDWPQCAGVYVLYDVSQRPIYVGEGGKISSRLIQHFDKFWFKSPIVEFGSYIEVADQKLRRQLEQTMIRFLKSNAVINKQLTEAFDED
jgi:transcriptional regulator with XRE-family HTH domain